MTPITEIGEVLLSDPHAGGHDYLLRPSLRAMMAIGTPQEIVETFAAIHSDGATALINPQSVTSSVMPWTWPILAHQRERLLMTCVGILEACAGDNDITPLVGEWLYFDDKLERIDGSLTGSQIIIIARHLMQHGIIGKAKVRQLQRHEKAEGTREFKAIDYINAARAHFDMTRDEASDLTMTEFIILLNQKYPPQKGDGLTRDEYDNLMDDYALNRARRIHAEKMRSQSQK